MKGFDKTWSSWISQECFFLLKETYAWLFFLVSVFQAALVYWFNKFLVLGLITVSDKK